MKALGQCKHRIKIKNGKYQRNAWVKIAEEKYRLTKDNDYGQKGDVIADMTFKCKLCGEIRVRKGLNLSATAHVFYVKERRTR